MTHSSSTTPPDLPLEIQHHILRLCDQSTLAITSLVCFAFLELSSPLLYNDIDITLGPQLEALFCYRDPALSLPHLAPYLSLSHSYSLTIRATPSSPLTLNLSSSRLLNFTLSLTKLTLRPIGYPSGVRDPPALPWSTLFPFLSPETLHIHGLPPFPSSLEEEKEYLAPYIDIKGDAFAGPRNQLRWVVLEYITHPDDDGVQFLYLRGGGPDGLEELVWDLSWWDPEVEEDERTEAEREVMQSVLDELIDYGLELCGEEGRARKFVVRFGTEEVKERWVDYAVGCWERWGTGQDEEWLEGWIGEGVVRLEVRS